MNLRNWNDSRVSKGQGRSTVCGEVDHDHTCKAVVKRLEDFDNSATGTVNKGRFSPKVVSQHDFSPDSKEFAVIVVSTFSIVVVICISRLAIVVVEKLYLATALLPTLGPIGPFIRGGKNTVFCSYSCRPRLDQGTVFAAVTINKDTSFAVIVVN